MIRGHGGIAPIRPAARPVPGWRGPAPRGGRRRARAAPLTPALGLGRSPGRGWARAWGVGLGLAGAVSVGPPLGPWDCARLSSPRARGVALGGLGVSRSLHPNGLKEPAPRDVVL